MHTEVGRGLALAALLTANSEQCVVPAVRRLQLFFECLLQDFDAKHRIGIHLLAFTVFLFKRLEPLGVRHVHHSILFVPKVQGRYGYLLFLTEALLA